MRTTFFVLYYDEMQYTLLVVGSFSSQEHLHKCADMIT